MRKILFLVLIIIISGCTTGSATYDELVLDGPFTVTYVVDGDTLDVGEERIRLSGINTPETGECYYQEAKDKLTELTLNQTVYLEKDLSDKGKYGRLLRYIYAEQEILVNELLVEEGFAKVYDKYSYDTKRYNQLKQVEEQAIQRGLGVWSCEDPKAGCLYVGSKNSDKYYPPTCKYAKKIKPENLNCYNSEEEVKDLVPAKGC